MNDPGLDDGKQDGHYPEQGDHPFPEVPVKAAIVFCLEKSGDGQDGGGVLDGRRTG